MANPASCSPILKKTVIRKIPSTDKSKGFFSFADQKKASQSISSRTVIKTNFSSDMTMHFLGAIPVPGLPNFRVRSERVRAEPAWA